MYFLERNRTCQDKNGGCMHTCMQMKKGHVCQCKTGHVITDNGKDCVDIDECKTFSSCSQICSNTAGSFKCSCHKGYLTDPGLGHSCKAEGKKCTCAFRSQPGRLLYFLTCLMYFGLFTCLDIL